MSKLVVRPNSNEGLKGVKQPVTGLFHTFQLSSVGPLVAGPLTVALSVIASLALLPAASAETVNVDELEHAIISLPNGQRAEVVRYNGIPYRVVNPEILTGKDDSDPDVCFEAKFDSVIQPNQVKLFGTQGTLIVENRDALRVASGFKRSDNVWFCGSLRKNKAGNGLEFQVVDMQKQLEDLDRYAKKITRLEKKLSEANMSREDRMVIAESAIDLGRRIEADIKNSNLPDFSQFDRIGGLRDKAYEVGLDNKEKAIKPDDADAFFELGEQWMEYRHKAQNFRRLVLKCLSLDPDHLRASRVADEKFGLVKFEGKWLRKEDVEDIEKGKQADQAKLEEARKAQAARFKAEQERAVAERPALLMKLQAALCTNDPKKRDGALETLGNAIHESLDPGFGVQAVDILANLQDHSAVYPGLDLAIQSQWSEVRRQAYEALAWRSSAVKDDQDTALKLMIGALQKEKNLPAAEAGIDALLAAGSNPALGALVAALSTNEAPVRQKIIAGLNTAKRQNLSTREEWEKWWQVNGNGK